MSKQASVARKVRAGSLRRVDVELAPFSDKLIDTAITQGWFSDEADNRAMGAGLGDAGRVKAWEGFKQVVNEVCPATGIYRRGEPVGFILWTYPNGDDKRIHFHGYISPVGQGYGVAPTALVKWMDLAFRSNAYRIEAHVLHINSPVIRLLTHLGFHLEGQLTAAYWMDDNPYDLVVLRMLRKHYGTIKQQLRV